MRQQKGEIACVGSESQWKSQMKLDERSSYLTRFACQFGRCRCMRLPFRAALIGDMLQRKIYEIFKDLPSVVGIADEIVVVRYDAGLKTMAIH